MGRMQPTPNVTAGGGSNVSGYSDFTNASALRLLTDSNSKIDPEYFGGTGGGVRLDTKQESSAESIAAKK